MKNRYLSTRIMAIMMAAAMAVSAAPAAFAAERADSETIKEDNQPAADADADAQDSADADKTADAEGTKTEYPLTITTYDYDGNEIETTYEKAPEKVLAVYQGSIETMLKLGLEDRLVEEKPSVMVLEPLGEDITNYGAKSLGGDMVTQLGATLANPDASTVGKEDIIAANPDVIFVVYMPYAGDDPETVKNDQLAVIQDDEALQSLDAVKNGRVYPIMLSEMYASATRTQDGIETFAKGLYPDVNLD